MATASHMPFFSAKEQKSEMHKPRRACCMLILTSDHGRPGLVSGNDWEEKEEYEAGYSICKKLLKSTTPVFPPPNIPHDRIFATILLPIFCQTISISLLIRLFRCHPTVKRLATK